MIIPDKGLIAKAWNHLRQRRNAYQRRLGNLTDPDVRHIMEDLASFCRASDTTFHDDPRRHALMEGRREVWLRLMQHLKLPIAQQFELSMGNKVHVVDTGEEQEE